MNFQRAVRTSLLITGIEAIYEIFWQIVCTNSSSI